MAVRGPGENDDPGSDQEGRELTVPITSKPIAAAEAIVDLLEQGLGSDSFSETFTVDRPTGPFSDWEDLAVDAMKVTVIPAANEIAQASRGSSGTT